MKKKHKWSLIALLGLMLAGGAVALGAHRADASPKGGGEALCHCFPDCRPKGANCI